MTTGFLPLRETLLPRSAEGLLPAHTLIMSDYAVEQNCRHSYTYPLSCLIPSLLAAKLKIHLHATGRTLCPKYSFCVDTFFCLHLKETKIFHLLMQTENINKSLIHAKKSYLTLTQPLMDLFPSRIEVS